MAKLSVPGLLGTLGAWYAGKKEGELQRRQEQMAQQQQATQQALALYPILQQEFFSGQERQLEPYKTRANIPNQSPESFEQGQREYAEAQKSVYSQPNPYAGFLGNVIQQNPRLRGAIGMFPQASPSQSQVPMPQPSVPKVRNVRQEQALSGILGNTELYLKQAIDENDVDAQNEISDLQNELRQMRITPEQAGVRLKGIVSSLQAKGSQKQSLTRLKAIGTEWDKKIQEGRIRDEDLDRVNALIGRIDSVDLNDPKWREIAAEVVRENAKLQQSVKQQPPAKVRLDEETRKANEAVRTGAARTQLFNTNRAYIDQIEDALKSGNYQQVLEAVDQQHSLAMSPEGQAAKLRPYKSERFGSQAQAVPSEAEVEVSPAGRPAVTTPGMTPEQLLGPTTRRETIATTRGETPAEIEARRLEAAAQFAERKEDQSKLKQDAWKTWLGMAKEEGFSRLPAASQKKIIENINRIGSELGYDALPLEMQRTLPPQVAEQIRNNAFQRQLATRRQDEIERQNQIRNERNANLDRIAAEAKTAKVNSSDPIILREADSLKQRIGQIHADLIKQNIEVAKLEDQPGSWVNGKDGRQPGPELAKAVERAERLAEQIESLDKRMQGLRKPQAAPSSRTATPSPEETRTVTFSYNGKTVTKTGTFNQFKEAFGKIKGPKWLQETWASGK